MVIVIAEIELLMVLVFMELGNVKETPTRFILKALMVTNATLQADCTQCLNMLCLILKNAVNNQK